MEAKNEKVLYEKEGLVNYNVGSVILLIMGVGVATLILIFVGVLGGQVYVQTESDINSINDTTVQGYIKDSIQSGFKALKITGNYLPIVVLAVIIFLILGLVMTLGRPSYGGGSAL